MSIAIKRPRHYAAEIIALPTREQRSAALAKVPSEWREWTKDHVTDYFQKQHFLKCYPLTRKNPCS